MYFPIWVFIGVILFIFVISIIVIFAFPRFSPIPYFPSHGKDIPLILKALRIRANQTIIDLGAGDGIVIFKAAEVALQKKVNTKFIAVEINPVLLLILHIRRLLHPNRNNIRIVKRNMFTCKYSDLIDFKTFDFTTIYLYISPWFIEKTVKNISKQIKNFDLVSYFYQVKCLPKHKEEVKEGVHKVYTYNSRL
jgi:predicted RNA methylase